MRYSLHYGVLLGAGSTDKKNKIMNESQSFGEITALPNTLVENPKSVRIHTAENGFTVNLEGGKQEEGKPYRHHRPYVAKSADEALKIVAEFLAD